MSNEVVLHGWQPINTAPAEVFRWRPVDLWMHITPSPLSMGMSDSFRVADCWRDEAGKWVHNFEGKVATLNDWYITHWMPSPEGPKELA